MRLRLPADMEVRYSMFELITFVLIYVVATCTLNRSVRV